LSDSAVIGVGLVGYGLSARVFHAPFVARHPRLDLRAIVQRRGDEAERDHPGVNVVRDLDALLADESVDLVIVNTPNRLHAPMAEQALRAGRHVLVEKPFAVSSAEADSLIQTARAVGRVLSVFQNRRFDGDFLTLRQLIESGRLGEIIDFEARFERYSPVRPERWKERDEPGAGILHDLGSHLIDQALVLFGLPERVRADLRRQRPGSAVDDYFAVELDYGRLRARLQAGMLVRRPGPHFAVHGTRGSFVKYGLDPQEAALRAGHTPEEAIGADPESLWGELVSDDGTENQPERIPTRDGRYMRFFDELVAAIDGRRSSVADPGLSRETLRIIEIARESSRQDGAALPFDASRI
jgi:scyllo-inositol 2-dehydrogenase (NADP+)